LIEGYRVGDGGEISSKAPPRRPVVEDLPAVPPATAERKPIVERRSAARPWSAKPSRAPASAGTASAATASTATGSAATARAATPTPSGNDQEWVDF
jgi:hypothetical protein